MSELDQEIVKALNKIAGAITPLEANGGVDAAGGYVASLTDSVMGNTAALMNIADALNAIANELNEMNRGRP